MTNNSAVRFKEQTDDADVESPGSARQRLYLFDDDTLRLKDDNGDIIRFYSSNPWSQRSKLWVESIDGATLNMDTSGETVYIFDTTGGPITVNLPLAASEPVIVGQIKRFLMFHLSGSNPVIVKTSGAEKFARGHNMITLPQIGGGLEFGVGNNGVVSVWATTPALTQSVSLVRAASFAAGSWSTPTAMPWDTLGHNKNTSVFQTDIGGANPEKLTALVDCTALVSWAIDIDSTGGSTWTATAELQVNGVPVANSKRTTGNFGGEDNSFSFPRFRVPLSANDELELVIDNTSLTGNLISAQMYVDTEI